MCARRGSLSSATTSTSSNDCSVGTGTSPTERLGLHAINASGKALHDRAMTLLVKWHGLATNPLVDPDTADACRVAARSCEGILAEIDHYD